VPEQAEQVLPAVAALHGVKQFQGAAMVRGFERCAQTHLSSGKGRSTFIL